MKNLFLFIFITFLIPIYFVNAQSVNSIDLSGIWKVTWNEGGHGPQSLETYFQSNPRQDPERFIDVQVPLELHLALQKTGLVDDINYGMNTLKARWVTEKYWLYVKYFEVQKRF
jgi:hypothetical protein